MNVSTLAKSAINTVLQRTVPQILKYNVLIESV